MRAVTALLLAICWLGPALAEAPPETLEAARSAGIVVPRAVGVAALAEDRVQTRQIAVIDCQRNAIEAGLGVMLRSETQVETYQLVRDSIEVEALDGFVFDFQILNEYERDELYVVEASCRVGTMPMIQELADEFPDVYDELAKPRIAVLFQHESNAAGGPSQEAQTALMKALLDRGMDVVDREQIDALADRDAVQQAAQGNGEAMGYLAAQLNCELLVNGSADQTDAGATVAARIYNAYDARILSAAVGRGTTPEAAVRGLLPGPSVEDDMLVQLLSRWLADPTILTCIIARLRYNEAMQLVRGIDAGSRPTRVELGQVTAAEASRIPVLGNTTLRNFNPRATTIEIRSPLRMFDAIEMVEGVMAGYGYEITGINGLRIDLAPKQVE